MYNLSIFTSLVKTDDQCSMISSRSKQTFKNLRRKKVIGNKD